VIEMTAIVLLSYLTDCSEGMRRRHNALTSSLTSNLTNVALIFSVLGVSALKFYNQALGLAFHCFFCCLFTGVGKSNAFGVWCNTHQANFNLSGQLSLLNQAHRQAS